MIDKLSFKARVTIATIGILVVAIWSLVLYVSHFLRQDMERQTGAQQFSAVSFMASDLERELRDRKEALEMIATGIGADLMSQPAALRKHVEDRSFIQVLFNAGIFVVGRDGTAIADTPQKGRVGLNYLNRDHVAAVLNGAAYAVGKPVIGKTVRAPSFALTVPIHDKQGRLIGALAGATDLAKPNFLGRVTEETYGRTGGYLIISRPHRLIVTATEKKFIMAPLLPPGRIPLIDRFVEGYEGSGILVNQLGEHRLASTKGIPLANWYLTISLPTAEAFAPVAAMQRNILLWAIVLTMAAGGLIWLTVRLSLRHQLAPVIGATRALTDFAGADAPPQILPVSSGGEIGELINGVNRVIETFVRRESALSESEERFRVIVQNGSDAILIRDANGVAIYASPQVERVLGYPPEFFLGQSMRYATLVHPDDQSRVEAALNGLVTRGEPYRDLQYRVCFPHGGYRWISATSGPIHLPDGSVGRQSNMRDINEEKRGEFLLQTRARLAEIGQGGDVDELLRVALDAAEEITESSIGFFHFVDPDQEHLTLQAWSSNTLKNMCSVEGKGQHYPISKAGVWVDAFRQREPVIHNDYASLQYKKGMPEGHAKVTRELVVPILHSGKVTELLGVGNKDTDYVNQDAEAVQMIAGMVQDLLVRQRAEIALKASELKLQTIFESAPVHIYIKDTSCRYVYANQMACRRLGRHLEEILGHEDGDLLDPQHAGQMLQSDRRVLEGGERVSIEELFRDADGRLSSAYLTVKVPLRDEIGRIHALCGISIDITERKSAEQSLLVKDKAMETSLTAIIITDVGGGIEYANPAFVRMLGYATVDEVLGKGLASLLGGHPDAVTLVERLVESGTHAGVVTGRKRDGTPVSLEVAANAVRDEAGSVTNLMASFADLTERKRLEEAHLNAQKLESLGTLAAGIAHDFNNILSAISGNADLAEQDVGAGHVAVESIHEIQRASLRATELVRRIMAFGRPKEANLSAVDLVAVVGEVLQMLRSTIPAPITFLKVFSRDLPQVLADAGQVHEAVVNLTTNAAYAIGARAGSIRYELAPEQVDEALARQIPNLKPGWYVRLSVSDTGCGMDEATMEHIFDVFYSTKPVGQGTGLGLSMVHGIMKSYSGAVTVESAPGKGASFHLYFPAAPAMAAQEKARASNPVTGQAPRRILFVDDEPALVSLAQRTLTREGHTVFGHTDPEAALQAFRADPRGYDVVVTDLSMPNLPGFELAREILAVRPDIPVIMASGYARSDDEAAAQSIGISELVLKPIKADELAQALARASGRVRPR